MDPVTLSTAVGWGISIAGWIMSPIATRLLNKVFPLIKPGDAMENLEEVVTHAIPRLQLTLEAAEASKHKELLQGITGDLKSAFYDMEDILDEVEYNRLSKQQLHNNKEKHKSIPDDGAGTSNKVVGSRGRLFGLLKETMKKIKELTHKARKTIFPTNVPRTKGSVEQRPNVTSKYVKIPTTTSHSADKVDGLTGHLYGLLKETLKKIKELTDKAQKTIGLTSVPRTEGSAEQRPNVTSKYVKIPTTTSHSVDKVTGRDEHRDTIINMLHDTCPSSTGIGIHGLPGSGKTTLAQYVCEFEKRDGHFDIVMWIHVTENFSVHAIYKEMFEAASESKTCPQSNSLDVLQRELEEKLYEKRVLLVLDDIWRTKDVGEQQLPELFSPIMKVGKEGSKILVTTRNKEALFDLGPAVTCTPYEIPDLHEKVFLELFMYHALGGAADQGTSTLQEIGAEIAEKLKRLPLAAKTVGGHLRRKKDVQSWITVRDSDILEHTGALWWSYQHLDEHVRRCFAYCSIFPRRFHLDRDELVKLWVAEGFINMVTTKEVEDVGREYFDELVATSFLQLGTKEDKKDKDYYLIHDLMHDLAEEVAGSDCFSIQYGLTGTSEIPKDVRHLFVQDVQDLFFEISMEGTNIESSPIMDKIIKLEKLRTLIIHSAEHFLNEEDLNMMFTRLRKLRVLVIKDCSIEDFSVPDSIGTAKHLRYLALLTHDYQQDSPRLTFPSTLAKLYHLQVLDFGANAILSFPSVEDMINLINLRHVIGLQDLGFQYRSSSLQTIPPFVVSGYNLLEYLSDLNKLQGTLEIYQLGYATTKNEALKANLAAKKRLTELALAWDYDDNWDDEDDQADVPEGLCSWDDQVDVLEGLCPPMLLEKLLIMGYRGPRYPNWMVCKQTERRRLLKLSLMSCSRLEAISDSDFFAYLQSLCIYRCEWEALPDNMEQLKSLKKLKILGCLKIRSLPTLPRTLGYFHLSQCCYMLHESCETSGDPNCEKIAHVTKKVIEYPSYWTRSASRPAKSTGLIRQ